MCSLPFNSDILYINYWIIIILDNILMINITLLRIIKVIYVVKGIQEQTQWEGGGRHPPAENQTKNSLS